MKQFIIVITNIIYFVLKIFRVKNLYWTWNQYKQNRIDAANSRNNTSVWFQKNPVKPRIDFQEWYKSIKDYFFPAKEPVTEIDMDNLINS